MGTLEIHAEAITSLGAEYIGSVAVTKDYTLFHMLGASGFKRYAALPNGKNAPRCKPQRGLPDGLSSQLKNLSEEYEDDGDWRWLMRDDLFRLEWDTPISFEVFVGPVGFFDFQNDRRPRRTMEISDWYVNYFEQIGAQVISNDEMRALLALNPQIVETDPFEHTARIVTKITWNSTLAESVGFKDALLWLRDLPSTQPCRLSLWIEA